MTREGTLLEKEAGLKASFLGVKHVYVPRLIADAVDPERYFGCRILDVEDIPNAIGEAVTLEVIRAITDRRSGVVRFDCRLVQTSK